MGTSCPTRRASNRRVRTFVGAPRQSGRALLRLRQALCGLRGHSTVLQFDDNRLFLQCWSCGHQSPGWLVDTPPPVRVQSDGRWQARPHPVFVSDRRIA
jgi:hypothetical protein